MSTSSDIEPEPADGGSRLGRAVVGVVVGLAIFAFVGGVGYFAVVAVGMPSWADSRGGSVRSAPARDAEAALSLPAVQAALDPLADGSAVDVDEVREALVGTGFEHVEVVGTTTDGDGAPIVGVGVRVPGGCVHGAVAPDAVTLDAGGPVAADVCPERPSH